MVLVAAISLLAGLLGFAISSNRERAYTAESLVLLEGGGGGSSEVETYVATKADRVTTSDVLTAAVENLEGESAGVETAGELRSRISVDANPELLSLTIEARAATADDAAALANATAEAYETVEGEAATASVDLAQAELESAISAAQAEVAAAGATLRTNPEDPVAIAELNAAVNRRSALQDRLDDIADRRATATSGIHAVEPAVASGNPNTARPFFDGALTAIAAAVAVGGGLWFVDERLRLVRKPRAAEQIIGAPLLAEIPSAKWLAKKAEVDAAVRARCGFVVTALRHAIASTGGASVVVTSAEAGEGKTLLSLHLALAASDTGRRVVLLDAVVERDRANRSLSERIRKRGDDLGMLLEHTPELGSLAVLDGSDVSFVPAPRDGSAALKTTQLKALIRAMVEKFDFVLFDVPAVLSDNDASALAAHTDATLLVVASGTPAAALEEVKQRLDLLGVDIVGYVFCHRRGHR